MTARAWWASALAGLGGVLGAAVGALLLRTAASDAGGMGELAGLVAGLMLGPPVGAFLGYLVALLAFLSPEVPRRVRAGATMAVVAVLGGVLVLIVLGIAGRTGSTPVAVGLLVLLPTAWFAAGAAFATYVGHPPPESGAGEQLRGQGRGRD